MQLIIQSPHLNDYLKETPAINFSHPALQKIIADIQHQTTDEEKRIQRAFEYARDAIQHSFDIDGERVTISASDTAACKEGICFAKAHLLAALLRGMHIPTGFCYQRVTRKGTPESGYALHGLNAVYLAQRKKWIRLDPRGNRPGVNAQFRTDHEQLAYPIRPELDERDYPHVFADPLPEVLTAMRNAANVRELFSSRPAALAG